MKRKVFESLHYWGQINYFEDTFRWQTDKRKRRGKNKRTKEEQSYWWNTVKASQLLKSEETEGASLLLVFKIYSTMERHRYNRVSFGTNVNADASGSLVYASLVNRH